jgi:hypothetical protein
MDDKLRELFYSDTLLGLATPKQLALAARESGLALTQAEARDFIRKQAVTQRFRPIARKRLFVPVTASPGTYQIDTLFVKGKPVIVMIELTSRKIYTAVVKNKTAEVCAAAFKDMLEDIREADEPIVSIESDDGGEFKGAFQRVLDAEDISHLTYPSTSASDTALSKVERVNLTLRKFLNKTKYEHLSVAMPKITEFYNNREHSATKKAPNAFGDADFPAQIVKERARGVQAVKTIERLYPVGAKVRMAVHLNLFEKKSQARWSKELFTVVRREGFSFFVEDSKGEERDKPLRAWEMLPVDEVQDRPKVDVEYLPAVEVAPAVVEPRPKRAPKVKVERAEAVLPKRVKKERGVVVVERVDQHRRVKGKLEFLTKYRGFPTPSWQPLANFYVVMRGEKVLNPLVAAYLAAHPRLRV